MKADSAAAIIEGLRNGGSLRQIFERDLYKIFFYFIGQGTKKYGIVREDAASAYSDTIISVIHHIVSGRFEGRSSLKSYCYSIFSNKCVDLLRKETTHKRKADQTICLDNLVFELPDQARNIIQQILIREDWYQVKQQLKALGEKCQQMLLFFEDGYSDKEIAGFMEYNSANVVKTSRLRCLGQLKKRINQKRTWDESRVK